MVTFAGGRGGVDLLFLLASSWSSCLCSCVCWQHPKMAGKTAKVGNWSSQKQEVSPNTQGVELGFESKTGQFPAALPGNNPKMGSPNRVLWWDEKQYGMRHIREAPVSLCHP